MKDIRYQAWRMLPQHLKHYVDRAYQQLVEIYSKVGCNTALIRASEIEARCYSMGYEEKQNESSPTD